MSVHNFDGDCNSKWLERKFGTWRKSKFDNSGTASSIYVENFGKYTGTQTSINFRIYFISQKNWYWTIVLRFVSTQILSYAWGTCQIIQKRTEDGMNFDSSILTDSSIGIDGVEMSML